MKIAIDYDSTFTADPSLFTMFIRGAKANGHDVRIVTFRHPDDNKDGILEVAEKLEIEVMFSDHHQKMTYCYKMGWLPDIWVDDKPAHIPTVGGMLKRIDDIVEKEDAEDDDWMKP